MFFNQFSAKELPTGPRTMSHTILLIQPTARADSRTWSDYETTSECLEGNFMFNWSRNGCLGEKMIPWTLYSGKSPSLDPSKDVLWLVITFRILITRRSRKWASKSVSLLETPRSSSSYASDYSKSQYACEKTSKWRAFCSSRVWPRLYWKIDIAFYRFFFLFVSIIFLAKQTFLGQSLTLNH